MKNSTKESIARCCALIQDDDRIKDFLEQMIEQTVAHALSEQLSDIRLKMQTIPSYAIFIEPDYEKEETVAKQIRGYCADDVTKLLKEFV
jgi:hypothetical protein